VRNPHRGARFAVYTWNYMLLFAAKKEKKRRKEKQEERNKTQLYGGSKEYDI